MCVTNVMSRLLAHLEDTLQNPGGFLGKPNNNHNNSNIKRNNNNDNNNNNTDNNNKYRFPAHDELGVCR